MIDSSLSDETGQQQEDVKVNDVNQGEAQSSSEESIDKEGLTVSAVPINTNLDSEETDRYV